MLKKAFQLFFQKSKKALLLILVGTFTWSLTMVKSGLIYPFGMGFWGANGHDGVWHIALINQLAKGNWTIPIFSGESIKNYHVLFDLLVAGLHKLTSVPAVNLYFQVIPPVLAFLIGLLTYKFVYLWRKNKDEAFWATLFVYFAGGWGWLVSLIRTGEIGGESMFWSQQSISTLINPPFALSLVMLLSGLIFAIGYVKKKDLKSLILSSVFLGLLIQTKAYGGALIVGGLLVSGAYFYFVKKNWKVIHLFFGSLAVSLLVFLPFIKSGASLFIYQPFWFLETLMAASDRYFWPKMAEAMLSYKNQSVLSKFVLAYGLSFLMFLIGNLGTRILGFYHVVKETSSRKIDWILVTLLAIIAAGIFIPMVFLQKGTPWNTIQFTYYSLFFMAILAGISLSTLMKKTKKMKKLLPIVILALTLPTTYGALKNYLPQRPPSAIPTEELEALNFLSSEEDGVVLTYPIQKAREIETDYSPPTPLYLYTSTAYVSAFSEKVVFLEDQGNVQILGYSPKERLDEIFAFLETDDQELAREFLKENNITHIYWVRGQRAKLGETQLGIEEIFENEMVDVYKVIK